MNRRQFLNAFGLGLIALSIPRIAKAQAVNGKRIITLADPAGKHIKLMKDGHQIGLVYWVNLDTGEYRRVPASTGEYRRTGMWMDFVDGPWDGGRIVRHPSQAGKTKLHLGALGKALREADRDPSYQGPPVVIPDFYSTEQYPFVDYESPYSSKNLDFANGRTCPLSVEGRFDSASMTPEAPAEIKALYPDLVAAWRG